MKIKHTGLICIALVFYTCSTFAADAKISDVRQGLVKDIKKRPE